METTRTSGEPFGSYDVPLMVTRRPDAAASVIEPVGSELLGAGAAGGGADEPLSANFVDISCLLLATFEFTVERKAVPLRSRLVPLGPPVPVSRIVARSTRPETPSGPRI
ncbi:unannotated protein [freshwater metagenome]|uniref:Unannotated protein n=1 Tax=freshwater metagenome TaxID=449393 RepID=A0A6J6DA36_9ZZZZ